MGEESVTISGRGNIRIVAGSMRGRRIGVPRTGQVRPTSEKVREAVFDVIGPIGGLKVLDLFAGSGAFGLEAVSRGARACVFVEADPGAAEVLRRNIDALGCGAACQVVASDYLRAAKTLMGQGQVFDLLFVDPPYRILTEVEYALTAHVPSLVSPKGLMVIEGPRSLRPTFGQDIVFERDYGETRISMLAVRRSDS
jgi:16S rRNA (guanine(966)-N(2))-methyltransferase RsmD